MMSGGDEVVVPEPRHQRLPRGDSVTLVIPRWVLRTVVIMQGTIDVALAVIIGLYFQNVAAQRDYTRGQINDLRTGICTALDYPPPSPGLFASRKLIGCGPYHHIPIPVPARKSPHSAAGLSGPQRHRASPGSTVRAAGPPRASSRPAPPVSVQSGSTPSDRKGSATPSRSATRPQPPSPKPIVTKPLPTPPVSSPPPVRPTGPVIHPSPIPVLSSVCTVIGRLPVLPPLC
jgi:hypothetical protein